MTPPSSPPDDAAPAAGMMAAGPVVFGTAGHVDHGKSALVLALTGIDPDRLAEEKARSMTIDLGFAWLTLPSGRTASIVDVPGHERFIKNMLAGAGGIDAALLVIAADEGVMPQTTEHLAILELLGISLGLVIITKTDLVDAEWLDLMQAEIAEHLVETSFANAPVVLVSARAGTGLDLLRAEMDRLADRIPARPAAGQPRLPVDRVFSKTGFGTVVTGTLGDGALRLGQELRLYPGDRTTRVRGLQVHGVPVERAAPGSRVAVNLAGVTVDDVRRGDLLAPASLLTPSPRLDVEVQMLRRTDVRLEQNGEVDVFAGAAELPARVTLLDRDVLAPGERGWAQLRFREPVAVLKGDRFVLRRPSPSDTIGGGVVVNPTPPRHKRFQPEVLAALATLATGTPAEVLKTAIAAKPLVLPIEPGALVAGLTAPQVATTLDDLVNAGEAVVLSDDSGDADFRTLKGYVVTTAERQRLLDTTRAILAAYHQRFPLRRGMPIPTLRDQLGPFPDLAEVALESFAATRLIVNEGTTARLPDFQLTFTPDQQAAVDRLLAALAAQPVAPPPPASLGLDDELLTALEDLGRIVRVSPEIALVPDILAHMIAGTLATIDATGSISLAQFRDQFQTSRKYAQAILEYLDRQRITLRIGERRVRFAAPTATRSTSAGVEP